MKNDGERENLFIILTGLGGSAEGYGDKYRRIADYVAADYGFCTRIEPTPAGVWERKEEYFNEVVSRNIQSFNCAYIMGVSAGANLAMWYSANYPQIRRILALNPVLHLNLHLTLDGVRRFCGEQMTIILGEKDPSAKWAGAIPEKENVNCRIIAGADHVFSGMLNEFIALPKRYLFDSDD